MPSPDRLWSSPPRRRLHLRPPRRRPMLRPTPRRCRSGRPGTHSRRGHHYHRDQSQRHHRPRDLQLRGGRNLPTDRRHRVAGHRVDVDRAHSRHFQRDLPQRVQQAGADHQLDSPGHHHLAGVPSIVFGLFGVSLFVLFFGWNISLMAGWFTLAFMVLR